MSGSKTQNVRVRFAPSPTGYLHVGGARTAFYNYLFAKQNQGSFVLRIEDTDLERSTVESQQMVLEDLHWLGLKWDEGPLFGELGEKGVYGPYQQSHRLKLYAEVAQTLLESGRAYYCFMTEAEIEEQKNKFKEAGKPFAHIQSPYSELPLAAAQARRAQGETAVVRFNTKNCTQDYVLNDLIRGEVRFPSEMVGDFVILRSDGMPVYNFCCAVDDHLMKISHVLRAEEHLNNTLRQLMIFEALGWQPPQFGHISLVLDENRQKLSKRRGATSCHEFKEEGFLPEALLNFVTLLGWTHPEEKEILTIEEILQSFKIEKLHLSGAVFDIKKLRWMNATHLRAKSDQDLLGLVLPFSKEEDLRALFSEEQLLQALRVFKPYMETLVDGAQLLGHLVDSKYVLHPEECSEAISWPTTGSVIKSWISCLEKHPSESLTEENFLALQDAVKLETQTKGKQLFMPLRMAVLGKPHGAELKVLVPLLSRASLLLRAQKALEGVIKS